MGLKSCGELVFQFDFYGLKSDQNGIEIRLSEEFLHAILGPLKSDQNGIEINGFYGSHDIISLKSDQNGIEIFFPPFFLRGTLS